MQVSVSCYSYQRYASVLLLFLSGAWCVRWGDCMMMVGTSLGVIFNATCTIVFSKYVWITVAWSDSSSGGSDVAARKEGTKAAWIHVLPLQCRCLCCEKHVR